MASDFGDWRDMESAPRDGTRILVEVRQTEQGPAEVDLVRWAVPERQAEKRWVSMESDPGVAIFYADIELLGWMPLPAPLPKLRGSRGSPSRGGRSKNDAEVDGSGI